MKFEMTHPRHMRRPQTLYSVWHEKASKIFQIDLMDFWGQACSTNDFFFAHYHYFLHLHFVDNASQGL